VTNAHPSSQAEQEDVMTHQIVFDRLAAHGRSNRFYGRCGFAVALVGFIAITAGAYADDRGTDYPRAAPRRRPHPPPASCRERNPLQFLKPVLILVGSSTGSMRS
jgi:hypothetical protein